MNGKVSRKQMAGAPLVRVRFTSVVMSGECSRMASLALDGYKALITGFWDVSSPRKEGRNRKEICASLIRDDESG